MFEIFLLKDNYQISKMGYEIANNLASKAKDLELLVKCKERHRMPLMTKPNVIGVGVGQRIRKGELMDELVVKVYVSMKLAQDLLPKEQLIPPTLEFEKNSMPTDVEESAIPEADQGITNRFRPLRGGTSIGAVREVRLPDGRTIFDGNRGTLGICVTLDDYRTYILSNNHVLTYGGTASIGDQIVQPSRKDGGKPKPDVTASDDPTIYDNVATLTKFVPIDFGTFTFFGFTIKKPNYVDCALAEVNDGFEVANREIHWIGYPSPGITEAAVGFGFFGSPPVLCKTGRTSGFTIGFNVDPSFDITVNINGGTALFLDQIRVIGANGRPFAGGGDSGSLVLDAKTLKPVGLHMGSSNIPGTDFAVCNRIERVTDALGIPRI